MVEVFVTEFVSDVGQKRTDGRPSERHDDEPEQHGSEPLAAVEALRGERCTGRRDQ